MPSIARVKTAKVPFALATPKRALVITDGRVPAPAVAKRALRLPATRKVRGVIANFSVRQGFGQRRAGENCSDNDDETSA
jgi:hypothetical protein